MTETYPKQYTGKVGKIYTFDKGLTAEEETKNNLENDEKLFKLVDSENIDDPSIVIPGMMMEKFTEMSNKIIKYKNDPTNEDRPVGALMFIAVLYGKLDQIKYLHQNINFYFEDEFGDCKHMIMDLAIINDHLNIVKWLFEHTKVSECSEDGIDYAAGLGLLHIIEWLHLNLSHMKCTTKAIDLAAANGHLDMVKWLLENRTEGFTSNAIEDAKQNGHLDIIELLKNKEEL